MNIQNGAGPYRPKYRDYDFIPSFHPQIYAGIAPYPVFPIEYLTDNTNWFPNQNAEGQPSGCTNYSTTKLARLLGIVDATVDKIEAVTHANAKGGYQVVASIDAARKVLGWFNWRFIIQSTGRLDFFDAFRLAQMSGIPELRAISWGTPWFDSWEIAALNGQKVMSMPTPEELALVKRRPNAFTWHNATLDGFSQNFPVAPGRLLYRCESHQGPNVDYIYFPRDVINVVQDLYGPVAVTATGIAPPNIAKIPLPQWFWELWHSWLGFSY